ncbi:hypothetical protein SAMN06309944_1195 [Micrococcales bacterium KH10]|nr:hypothetical protein SAMN06309944_1195 [Micrococcales bacterium KH10]
MASARRIIGRTLIAGAVMTAAAASAIALRSWSGRWGTDVLEEGGYLPGDEFLGRADHQTTRAIEIRTAPARIWPWLAQLGYGRGGFYSYDWLENLVGMNLHSAEHIEARWQDLNVGDHIALADGALLEVVALQPESHLVLRGGSSDVPGTVPFDFTWAFVLRQTSDARTRLIVRERYTYHRAAAPLMVEPVSMVSFLMSTKMLRGIKERAESVD